MTVPSVLILQNVTREGPGAIADFLQSAGRTFVLVNLDRGEPLPDPADFQALIVMGGPDSANDTTPKMQAECRYVRDWVQSGKPYLGICLGMQILAKAMGGAVLRAPAQEAGFRKPEGGFYEVRLTAAGQEDALFQELGPVLPVFQLHGETVQLPAGAVLLGEGNGTSPIQVFRVGQRSYGFQGHFEVTEALLRDWQAQDAMLAPLSLEALQADYAQIRGRYEDNLQRLLSCFLRFVEIPSR